MGATDFVREYRHYDWKIGLKDLKREVNDIVGYQQGYSGDVNVVDRITRHYPTRPIKTPKEIEQYINERLTSVLSKNEGEVIDMGIVGYSIAKAVVKEYHGQVSFHYSSLQQSKSPAILVDENGKEWGFGTAAELKKKAQYYALSDKFARDFYIVSKRAGKTWVVTGEGKFVQKTTRKSDGDTLVLPYHRFIVYGIAAT